MSPTSYQTAPSRINRSFFSCIHQLKFLDYKLVRKGGLEPPRPKALPPQGSVSTNSTTTAAVSHSSRIRSKKKGLNQVIRLFSVRLAKFHSNLPAQLWWFALISSYKHLWFVFWQTLLKLNW